MHTQVKQIRDYIVRPTLNYLNLPGGIVAEKLIMGTAAQESKFTYIKQIKGPALGLWQIEPFTLWDILESVSERLLIALDETSLYRLSNVVYIRKDISDNQHRFISIEAEVPGNLFLACALCRIFYYLKPFPMAKVWNVSWAATIWKKYYNTHLGKGKPEEFIENYNKLVKPIYE